MTFAITITYHAYYLSAGRLVLNNPEEKTETWNIANTTLRRAWDNAMSTARSMLEDGYAVGMITVVPQEETEKVGF